MGKANELREAVLAGDPPVTIALRRSAQARRFTLRVSGRDGRVTLTLPARARLSEALAFAEGRAAWLRRAVAAVPPPHAVAEGSLLPVEGTPVVVTGAPVRAPRLEGGRLLVPAAAPPGPAAAAFLRLLARDRLAAACDRHAAALGRAPTRLVLRDPRARWGSCAPGGALMFSWRLVMAPAEVLDYVAAHEVAHLAEPNHSPRFWRLVAGLMPGYEEPRAWLRRAGAGLLRHEFGT